MAYNYGPPPSNFGTGAQYGAFPGGPSMAAPPGTNGAPGVAPAQAPQSGLRPNFANMQLLANINFNAPVIHMGGGQPRGDRLGGYGMGGRDGMGNRGRAGLGMDSGPRQMRENAQPLTKEEVSRTIYVGGLVGGTPDDATMEDILAAGGGLRRWSRVLDADGNPQEFGFAEYEDAGSLEVATKLFEDLEVPLKKDGTVEKDEDGKVKKAKLMVIVDPASIEYIATWSKREDKDFAFKLDNAQDDLRSVITAYINNTSVASNGQIDEAAQKADPTTGIEPAEFIAFQNADEDLSDIPENMRELVASEIAAFRERSIKRDLERLRMEEEIEKAEKERSRMSARYSRLASPPRAAPKGPAGGANTIPVGPRADRAPTGPKIRGLQIPKDHVDGISFVNGTENGTEDGTDASDDELERRRVEKRDKALDEVFKEQERKWLAREKAHFAAVDRQTAEEEHENKVRGTMQTELMEMLANFRDGDADPQDKKGLHPFYENRREWRAARRPFKAQERREDEADRKAESREIEAQRRRADEARRAADRRYERGPDGARIKRERGDDGVVIKGEPGEEPRGAGFSLHLGLTARARIKAEREDEDEDEDEAVGGGGARGRDSKLNEMEKLLGDGDDEAAAAAREHRPLRPVEFKPLSHGDTMSDQEKTQARNELARTIPSDTEALFGWEVKWEGLAGDVVTKELRPYVEKKIMESLGVQEELLVAAVESVILRRGRAAEVLEELEETLDDEAEVVTRKVWKMVVFYSECGARGLLV